MIGLTFGVAFLALLVDLYFIYQLVYSDKDGDIDQVMALMACLAVAWVLWIGVVVSLSLLMGAL